MAENTWISIAALIAQILTAAWQVRTAWQIANPDRKPPKVFRSAAAKIIGAVKKFGPVAVGLALPLFGILWELSRPGPADDVSIFFIVLFTVALSFEVSMLAALALYIRLTRHVAEVSADLSQRTFMLAEAMKEQGEQTFEVFREVIETLDVIAPRKEPGTLDRLRDSVKKLLGG